MLGASGKDSAMQERGQRLDFGGNQVSLRVLTKICILEIRL